MKYAFLKIGLSTLCGLAIGLLAGFILMAKYSAKVLEISQASDTAQTVSTLYHLREQPIRNTMDLLENRVDFNLIVLSERPGALKVPEVRRVFVFSKEYRTKYPYTNDSAQIASAVADLLSTVSTNEEVGR